MPPSTAQPPAMLPTARPRRSPLNRAWQIARWLLIVLCALLLIQLLLLPQIVRRQVSSAFRGLGIDDVAFDIQSASPWGAEISDIRSLSSDRARINRVSVRYSPFAVMFGTLESIRIAGADIDVRMKGGTLDLGPLAKLRSSPSGSGDSSSKSSSVPFHRIELLSSVLRLNWDDRQLWLPIQGTLATNSTGQLDINFRTFFAGSDIPVTGAIDPAKSSLSLHISSQQIDAASLLAALPPAWVDRVPAIKGRTSLKLDVEHVGDDFNIAALIDGRELQLTHADTTFTGLVADVHIAGTQTGDGISAKLLPKSAIGVASIAASGNSIQRLQFASNSLPAILLEAIEPASATLGGSKPWTIQIPHARLRVAQSDLILAQTPQLRGLEGVLHFRGDVSATATRLYTMNDSRLSVTPATTQVSPVQLTVQPQDASPLLSIDNGTVVLHATASSTAPLSIANGSFSIQAPTASVTASVTRSGQTTALAGAITLTNASIADSDAQVSASNVTATIPFAFHAPIAESGSISIGELKLAGAQIPSPTGSAHFADGILQIAAVWEPLAGAKVNLGASLQFDDAGPRGRITAHAAKFTVSNDAAWRALYPKSGDVAVTGTFALDAEIRVNGRWIRPAINADLSNVSIASKEYDFALEGLNGTLSIDRFTPFSTPSHQVLTVASARIGKMDLADGQIIYRLENPHSLFIEQTHWTWASGKVYSYGFTFDPFKPVVDTVVYADSLSVPDILKMTFSGGDVTGSGTVYGRLPVKIDWPAVAFGNGFLYATPGEGALSLGSKANTVADLVEKSGAGGGDPRMMGQVKTRIMDALKNFKYDELKANFVNKPTGLTASIRAHGKGTTGRHPQELDLTINVNGVDEVFSNLLVVKKIVSSIGSSPEPGKAP